MSMAKNAAARKRAFPCHQRRITPRAPTPRAASRPRRSQCRQSANGGSAGKKQSAASAPRRHSGKCPQSPSSKTASATAAASAAQQSALRPQRPRAYARLPRSSSAPDTSRTASNTCAPSPEAASCQPSASQCRENSASPASACANHAVAPAAAVLFEQRVRPLQPRQRPALSCPVVQPGLQRRRAQPQIGRERDRSHNAPLSSRSLRFQRRAKRLHINGGGEVEIRDARAVPADEVAPAIHGRPTGRSSPRPPPRSHSPRRT